MQQELNLTNIAATATREAVTQGLEQAASSIIPDKLIRFAYYMTQSQSTLTNPDESAAFRELHRALRQICDPVNGSAAHLPIS